VIDTTEVLTGSFNWSYTAEVGNFENLLRINDQNLVQSYINNFDKLLKYGEGTLDSMALALKLPC
jgi:phosphatidylserine/phosphatidylglycerophosphate/cardiolipin synthase-like enzyme